MRTQEGIYGLGVALAGLLCVAYAALNKDSAAVKKAEIYNALRGLIGAVSFFMLVAGMLVIMICYFGHIDDLRPYVPLAFGGLALAAAGFYYGMAYQQDTDLVELAPDLGFTAADTGLAGPDGQYDIKGTVNGVQTLVNLEQGKAGRNRRSSFSIDILCRPANPRGLEFKMKPAGLMDQLAGTPPDLPGWNDFSIAASDPQLLAAAFEGLTPARNRSFSEEMGFLSMELNGSELVFHFNHDGYFDVDGKEYLSMLLKDCGMLAARFN
jgi:hypothetical protein